MLIIYNLGTVNVVNQDDCSLLIFRGGLVFHSPKPL